VKGLQNSRGGLRPPLYKSRGGALPPCPPPVYALDVEVK